MHLVEDDVAEVLEEIGTLVDHVAEDLGGHHDDRCRGVDRVVPGQQPDVGRAVEGDEVVELLVGQGFQRGRVEDLPALPQGQPHGEFGNDRLARPRRGRDEHGLHPAERLQSLDLERVELEGVLRREGRNDVAFHVMDLAGVPPFLR